MSFFYDGQDPECDDEIIANQSITSLLKSRDLALRMRHSRLHAKTLQDEYFNKLQLEIWFLEKVISRLDNELIRKLNYKDDQQQFHSQTPPINLGLNSLAPGKYFDKQSVWDNEYETLKSIKILFKNFDRVIDEDWKFI